MRRLSLRWVVGCVLWTLGQLFTSLVSAEAIEKYLIKDIGEIGSGVSVEGMNNFGHLVGAAPTGFRSSTFRAWWYNGFRVIDMGTCGGLGCRAMGMNDQDQIVGNIVRGAFMYTHGKFLDLAPYACPQSLALAVNELAEVVGWYTLIPVPGESFPLERHAFLYRGRQLRDLGTLERVESVTTNVNNLGEVVGYAITYSGESHAFLFSRNRMLDLGTLGGHPVVRNLSTILARLWGAHSFLEGQKNHAFLCADGKRNDLGALDGGDSAAICINKHGHIVGTNGTWSFLYEAGTMIDLMTLLLREAGWKTLNVRCINDTGQITGVGVVPDGTSHVLLLTPAP